MQGYAVNLSFFVYLLVFHDCLVFSFSNHSDGPILCLQITDCVTILDLQPTAICTQLYLRGLRVNMN